MRRRVIAIAFLALAATGAVVGVTLAARPGQTGGALRPPTRAVPLRVESGLPAWLAPGALLTVSGWAGPRERVTLATGSRRLVVGLSGPRGRFQLTAFAPPPGRYRVSVSAHGKRVAAGTLVIRPLVLAAAGDVTFGDAVGDAIAARGPNYPWLSVAGVLRGADLATANLEGAVSDRGSPVPDKEYHFRGPPRSLAAAAGFAGLDVMTVANNHTLDFGREAFFDTLRAARVAGIATVGGGADLAQARRPAVLEAGGLRVAFLGYSDVRPDGFTAGPGTPGTAPAEPTLIAADVRAALRITNVVVVWFHWGIERDHQPTSRQRELARAALDAGAAVVLGSHPHVLQPIERSGSKLVAWSLGNFVFAAHSATTESTGVLLVRLDARGVRGYTFRPARIEGVQPLFG